MAVALAVAEAVAVAEAEAVAVAEAEAVAVAEAAPASASASASASAPASGFGFGFGFGSGFSASGWGQAGLQVHSRTLSEADTMVVTRVDDRAVRLDAPRFCLVVPGGAVRTFEQARCTVGSHPSNDLVLEDETVSRFHCVVAVESRGVRVRDEGSANGTLVDGVRVQDAWLRDGAELRLGAVAVRFQLTTERFQVPLHPEGHFGGLVGESPAMRQIFAMLERCARTDATVLLEGETGTGKEGAAEAIHRHSPRADHPFVVVDAGALPPNLLESELFGHEKGAFTGAHATRIGAFEAADGGTVFLDEIGELPADLQPKLLRVLERRTIQRVGESTRRPIDVRFIAATNRNLREAVNTGEFRSDLYFRLAVVTVRLPPLRERLDDLPMLVRCLLEQMGTDRPTLERLSGPGFVAQLRKGHWGGNVRELRNHLERCLVLDAPLPVGEFGDAKGAVPSTSLSYQEARRAALDAFERGWLEALLKAHDGNVSAAARAADVNRPYLHRLLRRHGLR